MEWKNEVLSAVGEDHIQNYYLRNLYVCKSVGLNDVQQRVLREMVGGAAAFKPLGTAQYQGGDQWCCFLRVIIEAGSFNIFLSDMYCGTECSLSKFEINTTLSGEVNILKDNGAIQWGKDRLER